MIEIRPVAPGEFPLFEPLFVLYQEFYEVKDIDRGRNREFFSRFLVAKTASVPLMAGCSVPSTARKRSVWLLYRHKSSLSATDVVLMNDLS